MDGNATRGERLTTWAVHEDGERVNLGFEDHAGRPCAISLPLAALSGLMMTIPRMLRSALCSRHGDTSLRMIHKLGSWRVERAAGTGSYLVTLSTPDGFEVTFAGSPAQADRLADDLLKTQGIPASFDAVLN